MVGVIKWDRKMGTKVIVDQSSMDLEDWNEQYEEQELTERIKLKYNSKSRRQIEDFMEDRLLAQQLRDSYDEHF